MIYNCQMIRYSHTIEIQKKKKTLRGLNSLCNKIRKDFHHRNYYLSWKSILSVITGEDSLENVNIYNDILCVERNQDSTRQACMDTIQNYPSKLKNMSPFDVL